MPKRKIENSYFRSNRFYDSGGEEFTTSVEEIIEKFEDITTILERRYAEADQMTSDLALIAAERAIESAAIDREELDYIIFAHNFGETKVDNRAMDILPALASRLKQKLGIRNPSAVSYDILFGCPGWVQAVIQADYLIRSGDAKKILVVGADILSRISDPHDRDSMIYADGAGAAIMEGRESSTPIGLIGHNSRSDALEYAKLLYMGYSYNPELAQSKDYYVKMYGRRLYQYALQNVPKTIKAGLDRLNMDVSQVSKLLLHQANGKMDDAIIERLFALYGITEIPENFMPMTISRLGNSSVATVPTLLDMLFRNKIYGCSVTEGDNIVLASVGAGMNINSLVYHIC